MKIFITAIGTQGDIEPFVAIGELLRERGHEVVFGVPEQYAHLCPAETKVYAYTPRMLELLEGEAGRLAMGGGGRPGQRLRAFYTLYREGKKVNQILVREQYDAIRAENVDGIVHHVKCSYPLLWGMQTGRRTVIVSPVPYFLHHVEGKPHIGLPANLGNRFNRLTYRLANFGLVKTIGDAQRDTGDERLSFSRADIRTALLRTPVAFAISPQLFRRPDYWPDHVRVVGYHERPPATDAPLPTGLNDFLNRHERVLFLTFGSMVNRDPERTTRIILGATRQLGIPVVVNTAAGGLVRLPEFADHDATFFTDRVPYHRVLPRCYAIVHHGGSGTTHLGLRYGCASLILPHVFDQHEWNRLLHERGYGPLGSKVSKITGPAMVRLLGDLWSTTDYRTAAETAARAMAAEDHTEELVRFLLGEPTGTVP